MYKNNVLTYFAITKVLECERLTKAIRMRQQAELHFIAYLTGGLSCEAPIHLCARQSVELITQSAYIRNK